MKMYKNRIEVLAVKKILLIGVAQYHNYRRSMNYEW
jgi:hypothetical protein